MSLVSVVIAAYNEETHLGYCVESILLQSFQDFEIVIVNDGSTDNTENVIDQLIEKYKTHRISKINKSNGGLASARNASFPFLSTKYVTFLDADDYYDKDYLKKLLEEAEKYDCDLVCSGQHKVDEAGQILKTIKYTVKDGASLQRRLNISGKLYRVAYLRKWDIKFPEGKLYEDNSFNLQAFFLSSNIRFIAYEGYYQVVHEGSITSKQIEAEKLPFEEWARVIAFVKKSSVEDVDLELFDFTFLSFFTYFLMVRNRGREYLSNKLHQNSVNDISIITRELESITNNSFEDFSKNKYLKIFANVSIPLKQKIGTRIFWEFCKRKKLMHLVDLFYKF